MILQSLAEYYDRKKREGTIPDFGFERRGVDFLVFVTKDGGYAGINGTGEPDCKKLRAKQFDLPHSVKRGSNAATEPNLLADTSRYVIGADADGGVFPKHAENFLRHIRQTLPRCAEKDDGVKAVVAFLEKMQKDGGFRAKVVGDFRQQTAEWGNSRPVLSFQLREKGVYEPVFASTAVREEYAASCNPQEGKAGTCLVSGKEEAVSKTHYHIKNVAGAKGTGANLISFNADSFRSCGKAQGENAPVGVRAMFQYTTALNILLARNSAQKFSVGDTTGVVWAGKKNPMEDCFFAAINRSDSPDDKDALKVADILTGKSADEAGIRFYALGLAPVTRGAERLAVRFWHIDNVDGARKKLQTHFARADICRDLSAGKKERAKYEVGGAYCPTVYALARAAFPQNFPKSDSVPLSALAAGMVKSVLSGAPYPCMLLSRAVARCRVENTVPRARAALIKAYLMNNEKEKKLMSALQNDHPSTGYQLGRLFALLEKLQKSASGNPNAGIGVRFSGVAAQPRRAFVALLHLHRAHLQKLPVGLREHYQQKIDGVMQHIGEIPSAQSETEQGYFYIGYYHERNRAKGEKND